MNSFGTLKTLDIDGTTYSFHSLPDLAKAAGIDLETIPYSTKVLIENLLRHEDGEIVCTGFVAKIDFIKESGLNLQGNSIVVNERMETNIHGIFAVGDVTTHGAKLKLIATGVGEAAIAANWAKVIVDPSSKAFPGHSTSKFGH